MSNGQCQASHICRAAFLLPRDHEFVTDRNINGEWETVSKKKKQLRANGDMRASDRLMLGVKAVHPHLAAGQKLPSGNPWEPLEAMPGYGSVTAAQLRERALGSIGHVTNGPHARSIGVAMAMLCGMYLVRRSHVWQGVVPDEFPDMLSALLLEEQLGGPDHDSYGAAAAVPQEPAEHDGHDHGEDAGHAGHAENAMHADVAPDSEADSEVPMPEFEELNMGSFMSLDSFLCRDCSRSIDNDSEMQHDGGGAIP